MRSWSEWANTHQVTYIGSSTSRAAAGPSGERHRTAISTPASPCTAIGGSERTNCRHQGSRAGTRSASAFIPPSSSAAHRQKTGTARAAAARARGRWEATTASRPPSTQYVQAVAWTDRQSTAARQRRLSSLGGSATGERREPGTATKAAAGGGSRKAAARSTG